MHVFVARCVDDFWDMFHFEMDHLFNFRMIEHEKMEPRSHRARQNTHDWNLNPIGVGRVHPLPFDTILIISLYGFCFIYETYALPTNSCAFHALPLPIISTSCRSTEKTTRFSKPPQLERFSAEGTVHFHIYVNWRLAGDNWYNITLPKILNF